MVSERNEAIEQLKATSNVLQVISSFAGKLDPVFDAILANATRICEAKYGNLYLFADGAFRVVAAHRDRASAAIALERLHESPFNPYPVPPSIVCSGQKRPYKSRTCWLIKTIRMSTLASPCFSVKVFEPYCVSQ
jgi:hypothetical protein